MKYIMIIDPNICVNCNTCTAACKLDNNTGTGIKYGRVLEEEEGLFPDVRKAFVPILCMQCEDAECLKVCPTGATYRDKNGLIMIDAKRCMGCQYCVVACPYMARFFNEGRAPPEGVPVMADDRERWGTVEKCDFCIDRVEAGGQPACVESCPYSARIFGDLDNPDDKIWEIINTKQLVTLKDGNKTSVYYVKVSK